MWLRDVCQWDKTEQGRIRKEPSALSCRKFSEQHPGKMCQHSVAQKNNHTADKNEKMYLISDIFILIHKMIMCNVKGVALCDEPRENDHTTSVALSYSEHFGIFQLSIPQTYGL